jgi:stress-induced morphogen
MQVQQKIQEKLFSVFLPEQLLVQNVSQKHAHHHRDGHVPHTGETHFSVTIVSEKFVGLSRVERHRMVHTVLAEEMAGPVHALAIKAFAPGEPLG